MSAVYQVLVTTPAFNAGREAARRDLERDQDSRPIPALLSRRGSEFAAGYTLGHSELAALPKEFWP